MSVNLIATNRNIDSEARAKSDWAVITAIAPNHGYLTIDEDTVNSIARLLDGQELTNGEKVSCYAYEDEDPYAAMVCAFGPSLLPTQVQDQVRDRLANTTNGKDAVRLFDTVIRLGLQIALNGAEFNTGAHIKGVNWAADEVEINRTQGNMWNMLRTLGLEAGDDCADEVEFDVFAKAVNDNGYLTDMPGRLAAFVECGRRQNATHVYWA